MATATSKIVRRNKIRDVSKATVGIMEIRTKAAVAINCIRRWPAVRLAVSRTPNANGRINKLIVSIIIRIGTRGVGVPSGRRWPSAMVGWLSIPINTVINHNGMANAILRDNWVVGVKV